VGFALILLASLVVAQQDPKHETQLRTVHGLVTDKSETPMASAVVFLKNTRSNAVRSYISDDGGNYRFSGLDPNADYERSTRKKTAPNRHPHGFQFLTARRARGESEGRQEKRVELAAVSGKAC